MQVELLEDRQLLATITVNTTADDTTADATLSLREAIEVSNGALAVSALSAQEQALVTGAVAASNTINFNIPTTDPGFNAASGVWTIGVGSSLPTIQTNAAIIDGYTQPGATLNTLGRGDNAKLTIAINGAAPGTTNGLTIAQAGSKVSGLDIENFADDGILITGANVQVTGCFIGTDPTGETAARNGTGVVIENSNNTIGGQINKDRNVISGNTGTSLGDGLFVPNQADNPLNINPTGNVIENNFIGVDATGTKALGNGEAGVTDRAFGNTYGGAVGNVISGNAFDGIESTGSITIEGNFVGTDATGTVALGNGTGFGIVNQGLGNAAISTIISNNVISGNHQAGIDVSPGSQSLSTYTISNNLIGTDATGTVAVGNASTGLQLDSVENATVTNNVISGNKLGLELSGFGLDVEHNVFQGNLIGTDKSGLVAVPNTDDGVVFSDAIGNTFGGTGSGQGNVVAFNENFGVLMQGGKENQVTQNSIFGNAGAGIKLSSAANLFPPVPVVTFAPAGGSGTLAGTLSGAPNLKYIIEIFSNPTVPVAGNEQGKTFIQDVTVNTDGSGKGSFSVTEPLGNYTVTSTDPSGNTSQFSAATPFKALPATSTVVSSSLNPSLVGDPVRFTAVVTSLVFPVVPTGTVTFTIDGKAQPPIALALLGSQDEASFITSTLTAGPHSVSAAYSGDTKVGPSTGSLPTQTVNAPTLPATDTELSSSLNPSTVGQSVTFTAIVTAFGFAGTPTGTVTFTIDGHVEPPVTLAVVGGKDEAQFVTSTLTAGQHSVAAAYSGDSSVKPSNGSLPTQTVHASTLPATTTTVHSSLNPSTVGQAVTFTAAVAAPGFQGTPTGTVTFIVDGHAQTPVALALVGGVDEAKFVTSTLTVGQHSVTAAYSGDTKVAPSNGSLPMQTVKAPKLTTTTTTLLSSIDPSTLGQSVTFTAVVSPGASAGTPTGTVIFTIDGKAQTPVTLSVVGGADEAKFVTSSLTAGHHSVTAAYSGSSTFAASAVASPLTQTVNPGGDPVGDGPTVLGVKRFGIHMQSTVLVLQFSEALDPSTAQNLSNYKIVGPGGRTISIGSAVYDPATDTVTLRPRERMDIHDSYQLTVYGAGAGRVTDTHGTKLDGANNGVPGSNYTSSVTWNNVVWTPAEAKKYVHPKPVTPAGPLTHQFLSRPR